MQSIVQWKKITEIPLQNHDRVDKKQNTCLVSDGLYICQNYDLVLKNAYDFVYDGRNSHAHIKNSYEKMKNKNPLSSKFR